ncbi:MAG: uracil-DNA glycosylase [Desulfobacterales bacterium]|nr:uracil-DNA glycosylase [Desulfobacterales bacterium]
MIDRFFELLGNDTSDQVFNPWYQTDPDNDDGPDAPARRLSNLKAYLKERSHAGYLLCAEAVGYQGGHFTGIPMTSERIILGHRADQGISPEHVCRTKLHRTSNGQKYKDGFNEPTATIVWKKLIEENLETRDVVLWNAYPWHPFKPDKGLLSNRTPSTSEMKEGEPVLKAFLDAFNFKTVFALGNKADLALKGLGIEAVKLRHPAMGGAEKFRAQFLQAIGR